MKYDNRQKEWMFMFRSSKKFYKELVIAKNNRSEQNEHFEKEEIG